MADLGVGASILAKFQQINNEKEKARHSSETTTPFGSCSSSDLEKINDKRKRKSGAESNHTGLSENEVGITEYVNSSSTGFSGIIKHRFSDFQVHEIDLEGNIIELKCTHLPTLPEETDDTGESEHKSVLPEDDWTKIDEICESKSDAVYEIDVTNKDKAERTRIHKAIKFIYGPKLFSNTVTKEGRTVLNVGKWRNKERVSWPANQGQFLHFTVFKENTDTTEVVSLISQKLRTKANSISYSGTKDKRGKTTQRMCIRRKQAEELHRLKFHQITFGDYSYNVEPLRLGKLSGNKFTLAIRNVECDDSVINACLTLLKNNGFVNYYGLQRFGSSSLSPTFTAGRAILLKDWKMAVETILKPRNGEKSLPNIKRARETWWKTKSPAAALKCLQRNDNSIEAKVLRALKLQGSDQYFNALFAIPRNTMLLYVHAYQSLIWNKVVSKRLKEYGLKPLIGDLILDGDKEVIEETKDCANENDEHNVESGDDEQEKHKELKLAPDKSPESRTKVKKLTAEDISHTSFDEVVLPIPGCDIEYPDNITSKWYSEFLEDDGLTLEHFKNANEAFALYGSYRKVIGKPDDLNWQITSYNSFDDDLILSDLDKLSNESLPDQPIDSQYKAVILDFKLKPSQYATMLLREIMKCETSVHYHAWLTKTSHTNKEEPQEKRQKTLNLYKS